MAINIVDVFNSPLLQASANASQLLDLGLNLKQVSNDELMQELINQNKKYLETLCSYSERQILQNEIIIKNQQQIISLLGGNK